MSTGMILDGVLGSEAIDSSGEVLDVKGADISDVEKGTCLLNWEHAPGEKGPSTIVGIVLAAKKIYTRDDCENERQRKYWDEVQLPFIYGVCRLYDGAGHEEAKRIAAIIRDHAANNEPIVCRYSVEGATLNKDGNKLAASVVRRVAVTVKPCNRTAISGLIEDPNAPAGFDKKHTKEKTHDLLDFDTTEKTEFVDPTMMRLGKAFETETNPLLEESLAKTYTAGTPSAAPGQLTGGAALQGENLTKAKALLRVYKNKEFNRSEFRAMAKTLLPEASDEFLDHFSDMAEDFHVKRGQLQKKEAEPKQPKAAAPKPAQPKPAAPEPASHVDIPFGTIRGIKTMPNPDMKGPKFENGVLHTPKGSFPLYNPDKGHQMKEVEGTTTPHFEGGVLHVAPGTDVSHFHNGPNPGFREIFGSPDIQKFHDEKVMGNWIKNNTQLRDGSQAEEVGLHAAMFSMLSPNTPVRPHEMMYAHLVDTWEERGVDPRDENFKKSAKYWLKKDQPQGYPRLAREYFQNAEDLHLKSDSELTGRVKGDIMSFKMADQKLENMLPYFKMHTTLQGLVKQHRDDARSSASELMKMKMDHLRWKQRRQIFKAKVKQEAAAKLGLRNDFSNFVDKAIEKARAKGLMAPAGRSQTGDVAMKKRFEAEARKRKLKDHLDAYAEKATQSKIGDFNGVEVRGLAPKTARFTFAMMGGGNSVVPDTHFIRHVFGLDNKLDNDTISHIKEYMWDPQYHDQILNGIDDWYKNEHPAAQMMREHPKYAEYFKKNKDQEVFPAFWRHWISIAQDERNRGMAAQAAKNEFSSHEPFWLGIQKFVKSEPHYDERMVAKTISMHERYRKDYGEVPALMMFYQHLLPHLWETAEHRQKHDDLSDFAKAMVNVDRIGIELRKSAEEIAQTPHNDPMIPAIYDVKYHADGGMHHAGRYVIHNNRLMHLEDHRGLLHHLIPEGPVTLKTVSAVHGLKMSPHISVTEVPIMVAKKDPPKPSPEKLAAQPVRPPSVFEYHRAGMDKPHTLEVKDGHYLLDGEHLSHEEVQAVLENHKSGTATIRYKGPSPMEQIQKMEAAFADFLPMEKAEGGRQFTTQEMVDHARRLEASGHVPQGYSDSLNQMLHEDTLTPGMGNKAAAGHFLAKQKPGVYVSMDGNDFGKINKQFGQHVGDQAITAMGGAMRAAADEATPGVAKLFRNGGDEFVAHFPSHEHAAKFARALSQKLQEVPAIGGAHKLSFAHGFGTNIEQANQALIEAKKQKVHPQTGAPLYRVGEAPNVAHSLVPGHEGPLPIHNSQSEMMHQTMKAPASATPAPIPAPPKPKLAKPSAAA